LREEFRRIHAANAPTGPYGIEPTEVGRRSLRNLCLAYLMTLDDRETLDGCLEQFRTGDNMTDVITALGCLANRETPERGEALEAFYRKWREDPLVIDKWFTLQATSRLPGTLEEVKRLTAHPAFNIKNPNRVRSLIGAFAQGNPVRFHDGRGDGYRFLADRVLEVNRLNPQVAARLVQPLSRWRRYDEGRRSLMQAELERIAAAPQLSRDVYEIVIKSLR
jgi:aminopeptidase N